MHRFLYPVEPRLETIRRSSLRQVTARIARRGRQRLLYPWAAGLLYPLPAPLAAAPAAAPGTPVAPFAEAAAARAGGARRLETAGQLAARRFAFLNLPPVDLGTPGDWRAAPGGDPLWAYHLHYGEWAIDLAHAHLASGEERFRQALVGLLADWLAGNPPGSSPGWDPYPLSRRLVAWSRLPLALGGDAAFRAFWRERLEPSLRRQARFLRRNLEHDVPNNHLLANFRALAWVGLLFPHWPEAGRLREFGLAGLWGEMRRQVLADGVHAERSVSYHAAVLGDLLETWHLARAAGVGVPADVVPTLGRMLDFLAATVTPGGTWPAVNDSVPGEPRDPRELLLAGAKLLARPDWERAAAGRGPGVVAFPAAGYAVLRGGDGGYLLFDAGPMGPERIPGHGHADALSFELHSARRPLIVDPGVFTYRAGEERDRFRGMAAHSTVTVDGADPCTFWGPFRVAWPYRARLLSTSTDHVEGEHEGYRRLARPLVHRRRITARRPGSWEIDDRFDGGGDHRFAFTLQLAAGADVTAGGGTDGGALARWPDGSRLAVRVAEAAPGARLQVEEGWVSPDWNRKQAAPRLVLAWTAPAPCRCRVVLEVAP